MGQAEIRLAVFPPTASILLPRPHLWVSGCCVTADPEVCWRDRFDKRLAPSSALSPRFAELAARHTVHDQSGTDLPVLKRLYLCELMLTHDAREGIQGFLDRRSPSFTNQLESEVAVLRLRVGGRVTSANGDGVALFGPTLARRCCDVVSGTGSGGSTVCSATCMAALSEPGATSVDRGGVMIRGRRCRLVCAVVDFTVVVLVPAESSARAKVPGLAPVSGQARVTRTRG